MDQELKAYLDDLKTSIVKQATGLDDLRATMEERFAQQDARMEERFTEQSRHTEILIEAVRGDVRLVAEGVDGVSERLEAFQADTARRFEEGQASIAPYYRELNGRLLRVEEAVRVKKSRKRQTP